MQHRQSPFAAAGRPELRCFLDAIVEAGSDVSTRLILSDWLEEHDCPQEAELLRLHMALLATCCEPGKHPERARQQARLVELLAAGATPCVPRQTIALAEGVDMRFAWIAPGPFLMGSPPREAERDDDETQHRVTLTHGFHLDIHPVTQAQWQAVMGNNPSHFKGDDRPVEQVSWDDCQTFCAKLSQLTSKRFRLPSEWEYACRAGTTHRSTSETRSARSRPTTTATSPTAGAKRGLPQADDAGGQFSVQRLGTLLGMVPGLVWPIPARGY